MAFSTAFQRFKMLEDDYTAFQTCVGNFLQSKSLSVESCPHVIAAPIGERLLLIPLESLDRGCKAGIEPRNSSGVELSGGIVEHDVLRQDLAQLLDVRGLHWSRILWG
jgi:hypothetical protein